MCSWFGPKPYLMHLAHFFWRQKKMSCWKRKRKGGKRKKTWGVFVERVHMWHMYARVGVRKEVHGVEGDSAMILLQKQGGQLGDEASIKWTEGESNDPFVNNTHQ